MKNYGVNLISILKVKIPLNYQMKHAKSINIISRIFTEINLFSLGRYQILVLFGNAEFMYVVKYGNKSHIAVAWTIRSPERKWNAGYLLV